MFLDNKAYKPSPNPLASTSPPSNPLCRYDKTLHTEPQALVMCTSEICGRVCLALLLVATAATAAPAPLSGAPAESDNSSSSTPSVRGATPPRSSSQKLTSQPSPQDIGWTWPSWDSGSSNVSGTATSTRPTTNGAAITDNENIDYSDYTRKNGAATAPAGVYPACSIQASMNEDGLICIAGSGWLALTQLFPPQLGSGAEVHAPVDPNKELPRPLAKLPMPLPAIVPAAQSKAERPTYYFMYRIILNLYAAVGLGGVGSSGATLDLALPAEWTNQREYTLQNTNSVIAGALQQQVPFAVSYTRGDEMLVVVRGTIYPAEWQRDFQYQHAKPSETAPFKFPGNVHAGFFAVFKDLAGPLIDEEIKTRAPKKVTFTGHSLGGSVAALLAFYASMMVATTELISFGAPNVGDATFSNTFNTRVNNRHLAFSGVGSQEGSYLIGDWISQVPCGAVTTCPLLTEMSSISLGQEQQQQEEEVQMQQEEVSYDYTALGGAVPFTPADMLNSKTWATRSDVTSFRYSPVASHVCSYMCFTAPSVGDDYNQCVFTLEVSDVDMDKRCVINL